MGVAASLLDDSEAAQFASFLALKDIYDSEFASLIDAGEMTQTEALELMKTRAADVLRRRELMRSKARNCQFSVGDIATTTSDEGAVIEGVIISIQLTPDGEDNASLDDGSKVHSVLIQNLTLKYGGETIELRDQVEVKEEDSHLRFQGVVTDIHEDGTYTVKFDGDDDGDIESGIKLNSLRKISTGRNLACMRWKKVKNAIRATALIRSLTGAPGHFGEFIKEHSDTVKIDENEIDNDGENNGGTKTPTEGEPPAVEEQAVSPTS